MVSLETSRGELERRVRERTAELEDANELLRAERGRLQSVLDNIADAVVTISDSGIIQSFSPSAERMFGYTAREVTGQEITVLMPEPDQIGRAHV
jgi:two-component system sensor kinase FixL